MAILSLAALIVLPYAVINAVVKISNYKEYGKVR